jgi:hypothetical protein
VKPVFLLGCYGCVSHATGNPPRPQNFAISGGGVGTPLGTPVVSIRAGEFVSTVKY